MIDVLSLVCRRKMLLQYFGEPLWAACENCDNCFLDLSNPSTAQTQSMQDVTVEALHFLKAVQSVPERGMTKVLKVLLGRAFPLPLIVSFKA
jgi:superfamily II DNA helicase RecQ